MAVLSKKYLGLALVNRQAQWKLTLPGLINCQCHELTMPHRVCPECGYYGGKQIVDVEKAGKYAGKTKKVVSYD